MTSKNWQGGSDDWNTNPADWNPTGVPTSADDVTIATGDPQVTGDVGAIAATSIDIMSGVTSAGTLTFNNGSGSVGDVSNQGGFIVTNKGNVINNGTLRLDAFGGQGGSALTIVGGTLTNGNFVQVGNGGLFSASTLTANQVFNTGTIELDGTATAQATLNVTGAAGLDGGGGTLQGGVHLGGNTLLEFASGQITSVASGGDVRIVGSNARIALSGSLGTNSALTGLAGNAGSLSLENGATVTTTGDFNNNGFLGVDDGFATGGSSLTIGGVLTNSGTADIGNGNGNGPLSAPVTVTVNGLANTGTINLVGSTTNAATLNVKAGLGAAGALTGQVNLSNDALLEFASGQIASIAAGNELTLNGANSFVADAGATTSNSALTGLASNAGGLSLENQVSVATTGDFNNTGTLGVDN